MLVLQGEGAPPSRPDVACRLQACRLSRTWRHTWCLPACISGAHYCDRLLIIRCLSLIRLVLLIAIICGQHRHLLGTPGEGPIRRPNIPAFNDFMHQDSPSHLPAWQTPRFAGERTLHAVSAATSLVEPVPLKTTTEKLTVLPLYPQAVGKGDLTTRVLLSSGA